MSIAPAVGVHAGRVRRRSPWTIAVALTLVVVLGLSIGVGSASAAPNSLWLRATYDVAAHISWSAGTMTVSSTANVVNTTNGDVQQVAFNLITLRTGAARLLDVTVDGTPVNASVGGQTIVVPLPGSLSPGAQAQVRIDYRASFNSITGDKRILFAKKDGIVTAYRWIPWLSRQQPFKTSNLGETWVTAVSPRVRVRLTSDAALKWATSGRPTSKVDGGQTFEANHVRDFNFSASPWYSVAKFDWNGVTIRVYTRRLPRDVLIRNTRQALNRFSDWLGPYPYGRLTIAETPSGTGMESPALNWVSSTLGGSRLRHIVVHEVAHQWFFAAVGNNQATNPFVDEAVSDFLTRLHLGTFRHSQCAQARLDLEVYDYSAKCYPEVIYVQGAHYLDDYRQEVGTDIFLAGLRRFYRERTLDIVRTRALLDALDAESGFDSARHAERFPSLYR